jgi:ketosteroid isomerase-like protein
MSQDNVEVVRAALDAFARGELEEMLSYIDPAGELHSAIVGGAEGSVYRGHEGLRSWYTDTFEAFEELRGEWSEFRDLGDRVLVLGRAKARGRGSGMELDSPMGWVFTMRDGKVVRAEGYLSRAETLEAAGLRE